MPMKLTDEGRAALRKELLIEVLRSGVLPNLKAEALTSNHGPSTVSSHIFRLVDSLVHRLEKM